MIGDDESFSCLFIFCFLSIFLRFNSEVFRSSSSSSMTSNSSRRAALSKSGNNSLPKLFTTSIILSARFLRSFCSFCKPFGDVRDKTSGLKDLKPSIPISPTIKAEYVTITHEM